MPPAIIAAGIGVAGAVGGAVISSNSAKSAANTAAQTADKNNALQQQIYQQNTANEQPFMQRGNAAGAQINALLGLGGSTPGTPGQTDWGAYVNGNPDALANWQAIQGTSAAQPFGGDIGAFGQYHYGADGSRRDISAYTSGGTPGTSAQDAANNAFSQFKNSSGYQFRLGEGLNAANTNYALRGAQGSGAALKALNNYAQGQASNEFGNYTNLLQGQQATGLSAANALNGVGTNYANAVSSNNNNAASAAGNAAIQSGNAFRGALNGLGTAANLALGNSSSYSNGGSSSFNSAFDSNFLNSVNGG